MEQHGPLPLPITALLAAAGAGGGGIGIGTWALLAAQAAKHPSVVEGIYHGWREPDLHE